MNIRTKLFASYLIVLFISIITLMSVVYFILVSDFEKKEGKHLKNSVAQAAKAIDAFMFTRVKDLSAFSNNPIFSVGSLEDISDYLLEIVIAHHFYDTLSYTNKQGIIIATSDKNLEGKNILKIDPNIKEQFQKTISGDPEDVYICDLSKISKTDSEAQSPLDIEMLSSVVDKNKDKQGVCIGFINTRFLKEFVFDIDKRITGNDYAYLLNNLGNIVITADSKAVILKPHPDLNIGALKQKLEGDKDGYTMYINHKGRKVIAAYADLSEYGTEGIGDWSLLFTTPYNEIMEPVFQLFYKILIIFILISALIIFIVLFLSNTLTDPIMELKNATVKIAKGELNVRVKIKSKDEIGILGKAFNKMVSQLDTTIKKLMQEIAERKRAEMALKESEGKYKKLNIKLEQIVQERTNQLEITNKELESFSYSVSHDLRAPLRGIDGFSQALMEDFEDKLDNEGKDFLIRIRASTRRMGHLIDDLLKLSRLSRVKMQSEPVNLSILAEQILKKIIQLNPERDVEFTITPDLTVCGDPSLLEIMLENLLNNAWKFTGKKENTKIDFGTKNEDGKTVYFIRDNGVGFDMTYSNKLFGAFQRLHTTADFPGTGIGLATVQRIIHRHNGQIWAESKSGEGATFYFRL